MQGPDFPTGGFILGRQGFLQAYTTGRGQLKIRARAKIERMGKDREQIIIDEIPYQVGKIDLGEAAAEQLGLVLDPYPRMDGVAMPDYDQSEHAPQFSIRARQPRLNKIRR